MGIAGISFFIQDASAGKKGDCKLKRSIIFIRKSNPQAGGVEMQMMRIATRLKNDLDFSVYLGTDDIKCSLARMFRSAGMNVFFCKLAGLSSFPSAYKQIRKIMDANNVTILQAHMFRESILCRLVKLFNPRVRHYYRVETYIDCSPISSWKKRSYHLLASVTDIFVDRYFANGHLVAMELQGKSHISESRIDVIYNGVEQPGEADNQAISLNPLRLAMVANFIPGKGHEYLFEAIALLKKDGYKINASLFGDTMDVYINGIPYMKTLSELVSRLNINDEITFKGFSNKLHEDLHDIHTVVLPSDSEGTPNSILEAMSQRKLVITSDAGSLPYLVEDGVSGLVHPAGDINALKEKLLYVFHAEEAKINEIRSGGWKRWKELFSLDGMMERLNKYYG